MIKPTAIYTQTTDQLTCVTIAGDVTRELDSLKRDEVIRTLQKVSAPYILVDITAIELMDSWGEQKLANIIEDYALKSVRVGVLSDKTGLRKFMMLSAYIGDTKNIHVGIDKDVLEKWLSEKIMNCGKKKLVLEFDDTPAMRAALSQLAAHAHDDEASFFEDDSLNSPGNPDPEMEQAFRTFHDVTTLALHPEVADWPQEKDFLDEMISERAIKNPEYPKLVEEAANRRRQKREQQVK